MSATTYAKGDRFIWMGSVITVLRTARDGSWADIDCKPVVGAGWTKRQPLPLPDEAVRMPADHNPDTKETTR
jgi:hypothetical protein